MDRWEQINFVQNMQDYIDRHLNEPIACQIWPDLQITHLIIAQ